MTQKQTDNNNTATTTTYPTRLHAAYLKLDFKSDDESLQDTRREHLFQRLALHHLAAHGMTSLARWHMSADARETCLYDFIQTYAKALWPGSVARRAHLAAPALRPKDQRSFVGAFDGQWTQKANGAKTKPAARTAVAEKAASKIGKALKAYVEVVLEMGVQGAGADDAEGLVEGILQTEEIVDERQVFGLMGGVEGGEAGVKMEVDDDLVMVKVEDEDD